MDKTIEFAKKVYGANTEWSGAKLDRLEQIVALVRADERDACAKLIETHVPTTTPTWVSYAAAIRARK